MQDIDIVSSRAPTVDRLTSARYVYLTFEGLRESRTISDKHTRIRIALPLPETARLGEMLAELSDREAGDVVI
jgi:hypothetical protein